MGWLRARLLIAVLVLGGCTGGPGPGAGPPGQAGSGTHGPGGAGSGQDAGTGAPGSGATGSGATGAVPGGGPGSGGPGPGGGPGGPGSGGGPGPVGGAGIALEGLACPATLDCRWAPSGFGPIGNSKREYKFAPADRPRTPPIRYIVIHSTEGSYSSSVNAAQSNAWPISWHYTVRSNDGQVTQHLNLKDGGWHSGNHFVSWESIGIEHEGYSGQAGWYTDAMYRSSAALVRYLAISLGIPLDRQHILGHDNVPAMNAAGIPEMHWDPGPLWDWNYYFSLIQAPVNPGGDLVTINPDFASNQLALTGCRSCAGHGSSAALLRTAPSPDAPLLNGSTMLVSDHGARASAGQRFVVAEVRGEWSAIWYLGQKAWLLTKHLSPSRGQVAKVKPGKGSAPVYGWPLPELPEEMPYVFGGAQAYAVGEVMPGFRFQPTAAADGTRDGTWTVAQGTVTYVQIQFGHRVMFVNRADVDLS